MRNLFDQFSQPENRLTHALMSSLHEDRRLLTQFVQWATNKKVPPGPLYVLEQALPGEESLSDSDEMERRGLPDGWIHDGNCWSILIESKIACRVEPDQLRRHRCTAKKRGFADPHLLVLVVDLPDCPLAEGITVKRWTELYKWLKESEQDSQWASRLRTYMEVLEVKLSREEYLKGGTLTVFTGIPFGPDYPYNYPDAKRVLRLAMDELRKRSDLYALGIDRNAPGRTAITGKDATAVWDFLQFAIVDAKRFTEFPHLTIGIHNEYLHVVVIIPNGIRNGFRRSLLDGGIEGFRDLFRSILIDFKQSVGKLKGVIPSLEVVQRRYPSQRAEPFIDARLEFDLRTGFKDLDSPPKWQPQWLEATYNALSNRNSNLQLAVGAKFFYGEGSAVNTPEILEHIAETWLTCKPLIEKMIHSPVSAEETPEI